MAKDFIVNITSPSEPAPTLTAEDFAAASARMQAVCIVTIVKITNTRADLLPILTRLLAVPVSDDATQDERAINLSINLAHRLCSLLSLAGPQAAYERLAAVPVAPEDKAA